MFRHRRTHKVFPFLLELNLRQFEAERIPFGKVLNKVLDRFKGAHGAAIVSNRPGLVPSQTRDLEE